MTIPLYNEVKPGQIFPPSKTITNFPVALVNDLIQQLNAGGLGEAGFYTTKAEVEASIVPPFISDFSILSYREIGDLSSLSTYTRWTMGADTEEQLEVFTDPTDITAMLVDRAIKILQGAEIWDSLTSTDFSQGIAGFTGVGLTTIETEELERIIDEFTTRNNAQEVPPGYIESGDGDIWIITDQLLNVQAFGSWGDSEGDGDGSADPAHDDAPAFQALIDMGILRARPFVMQLEGFGYNIQDELHFGACRYAYSIFGRGMGVTGVHPGLLGANKKVWRFDSNESSTTRHVGNCMMTDISISRTVLDDSQPIAIFITSASRFTLDRIFIAAIANTGIWCSSPFNCRWGEIYIFSGGNQRLYREASTTARITTVAGDPTVTVTEDQFADAAPGEIIYLQQAASNTAGFPDNSALVTTITAKNSDVSIEVDPAPFRSRTSVAFSWDSVRGSISTGTDDLTLNADVLDAAVDEGRFIYIWRAGADGRIRVATIDAVLSPSTCTISTNAGGTVADEEIWFAPSVYIGSEGSDEIPNDIKIMLLHIETFRGPAVIADEGIHLFIDHFKAHGRTWSGGANAFAQSRAAFVNSGYTMSFLTHGEFEFGCHSLTGGYIMQAGERASTRVDNTAISSPIQGGYFAEIYYDSDKSFFSRGDILTNSNPEYNLGILNEHNGNYSVGTGFFSTISQETSREGQLPEIAFGASSAFAIELADNEAMSFEPPNTNGLMSIWTSGSQSNALFYFRVNNTPVTRTMDAGTSVEFLTGPLTGTTGTDGKLVLSVDDDLIYIENRLGAALGFSIFIQAS